MAFGNKADFLLLYDRLSTLPCCTTLADLAPVEREGRMNSMTARAMTFLEVGKPGIPDEVYKLGDLTND